MPNIWTHILFGDQLIEPWKEQFPQLDKYKRLFHLGCQGPDFLFYHHFLPWQQDLRMTELGNRMHREHCGPVLLDFIERAIEISNHNNREQVMTYFLGFLTHHILDRNFHPYVHVKAGYQKWDHQRFEIILDTLMLFEMKGIATWNTPVWKEIDPGKKLPDEMISILADTTAAWYEEVNEIPVHHWQDAYQDMIRAQKLFHDPYGFKRVLTFGKISALVYKRNNPPLDYLNEAKASWQHPAVETESYNDSAWDLWDQSLEDGRNVFDPLMEWLSEHDGNVNQAKQRFKAALGNLSYDTGKSCESGLQNHFAQPIWKDKMI